MSSYRSALVLLALSLPQVASAGEYTNVIPTFVVALDVGFTEICFKAGSILVDRHPSGGTTSGGNCRPGDKGYVLEVAERPADLWVNAMASCLADGWRMPDEFEWFYACENNIDLSLGLANMTDDSEWAGDEAVPDDNISAAMSPTSGCWPGYSYQLEDLNPKPFRCAK